MWPFVGEEKHERRHEFVEIEGESFYRIRDYPQIGPFLVNVVSASDLWMFVSSHGGLTSGRVDADGALFAYQTVDRLHDAHHQVGPTTSIRFDGDEPEASLWEPFLGRHAPRDDAKYRRNMYKSLPGNQIIFEERLVERGMAFCYRWSATDEFGFVRTATLVNESKQTVRFDLLDGLRNIQPWGVSLPLQQGFSCLTNAYKRSELDSTTKMGIFSLTAGIVDGTYPAEVLRSNVVWHTGLDQAQISLSDTALTTFRNGGDEEPIHLLKGLRGNYFAIQRNVELEAGGELRWQFVADVGLGHVELAALRHRLLHDELSGCHVEAALRQATLELRANVAASDGLQHTNELVTTAHHFSNVLFNNMRGGVFVDPEDVASEDVVDFIKLRNTAVFERNRQLLSNGAAASELLAKAKSGTDADLRRLANEFMPLTFSRRHGDPSRPWNRFSIELKKPDGSRALKYQGNWRDIFQNWEALSISFPAYLENMVTKFVNGSTMDGFNPYRVTERGMEWEVPEPESPWANIGYWGDHQIVYLLKLLEALHDRAPDRLNTMLSSQEFVYLRVPYRLKSFAEIVRNPRETITYDSDLEKKISVRCEAIGEDGKLLCDDEEQIVHASLCGKMLVPMLSKLSNLVVGGGIWMNTQRPEWNDANNALVGNGLSVVTLCYLLRYVKFFANLVEKGQTESFEMSQEIAFWMRATKTILDQHLDVLAATEESAQKRREILDALGQEFSEYREQVYEHGLSGNESVSAVEIVELCQLAGAFAEFTIRQSQQEDSLYHAYNLADFSQEGQLGVRNLYEMLEGQVAVLSSGTLAPEAAADLVDAMYKSRLYRPDQHSFMLYPDRELPSFLEKNVVPEAAVASNPLLCKLLEKAETTIIQHDSQRVYRFHADFKHSLDLRSALDGLCEDDAWRPLVSAHRRETLELFDDVFQHQKYTGRSGTMYGYEGLGCIYWHMVAKLLLAVQENYFAALESGSSSTDRLGNLYFKIRSGLGFSKSPREYGAFPVDAYSHSPKHTGAQQPGMTGQVKEEILTRFGELGVAVRDGSIRFAPSLLGEGEFFVEPTVFDYCNRRGEQVSIELPTHSLAFTYCQVPVIYQLNSGVAESITVSTLAGDTRKFSDLQLDRKTSQELMSRSSDISSLLVRLNASRLFSI